MLHDQDGHQSARANHGNLAGKFVGRDAPKACARMVSRHMHPVGCVAMPGSGVGFGSVLSFQNRLLLSCCAIVTCSPNCPMAMHCNNGAAQCPFPRLGSARCTSHRSATQASKCLRCLGWSTACVSIQTLPSRILMLRVVHSHMRLRGEAVVCLRAPR